MKNRDCEIPAEIAEALSGLFPVKKNPPRGNLSYLDHLAGAKDELTAKKDEAAMREKFVL